MAPPVRIFNMAESVVAFITHQCALPTAYCNHLRLCSLVPSPLSIDNIPLILIVAVAKPKRRNEEVQRGLHVVLLLDFSCLLFPKCSGAVPNDNRPA